MVQENLSIKNAIEMTTTRRWVDSKAADNIAIEHLNPFDTLPKTY